MQVELVMLIDSLSINLATSQRIVTCVIEEFANRVELPSLTPPLQHILTSGVAQEMLQSSRTEVQLARPWTPQMQNEMVPCRLPFFRELLPKPTKRSGHHPAAVGHLHPLADLF